MDHPEGAGKTDDARLGFDRRVRLEFHGSKISSDGGLLLFRELDDVLGLHDLAGGILRDTRTGHNRLHSLVGLLRQSVFGRLAGYEDVNDADRLALDPVMRQVVGGRAVDAKAASASQMGRFETEILETSENRATLANLSGQWIDRVHEHKPPKWITLDMDSSVNKGIHLRDQRFRKYTARSLARNFSQGIINLIRLAEGQDRSIVFHGVSLLGRFWQAWTPATIRRLQISAITHIHA